MKKILIPALILLLVPVMVTAADDAVFQGQRITLDDYTLEVIGTVDEVVVTDSTATFTLAATSDLTIRSYDRVDFSTNLVVSTLCGSSYSELSTSGNDLGSTLVVGVGGICAATSGGGGGGGGGGTVVSTTETETTAAEEQPVTSTGQITATAGGGGKTTLTTDEGTTAVVDIPANAVGASTEVQIQETAKETVTESRPTPANRQVVGGYAYEYTAMAGETEVNTFEKNVTLTFTYTDNQITGLQESTLKIYYWKESTSQWVALPTTVDEENNTVSADSSHFTYFAIMGLEEGFEEEVTDVSDGLIDGDLVRNPNAEGMAQFDIYIVKMVGEKKFKRLILSPHVFESYAHFDKNGNGSPWDDVIDITQETMDNYVTSDLVRADGDTKVYQLTAEGDTGTKGWLNMTAEEFTARGYDTDSIYTINMTDRDAYITGADIM